MDRNSRWSWKMESGDLIECTMENTAGLMVSKMIGKCVI